MLRLSAMLSLCFFDHPTECVKSIVHSSRAVSLQEIQQEMHDAQHSTATESKEEQKTIEEEVEELTKKLDDEQDAAEKEVKELTKKLEAKQKAGNITEEKVQELTKKLEAAATGNIAEEKLRDAEWEAMNATQTITGLTKDLKTKEAEVDKLKKQVDEFQKARDAEERRRGMLSGWHSFLIFFFAALFFAGIAVAVRNAFAR